MIACELEVFVGAEARLEAQAWGYHGWMLVVQWRTYSDGTRLAKVNGLGDEKHWVVVWVPFEEG